jgi:hypothetical protein
VDDKVATPLRCGGRNISEVIILPSEIPKPNVLKNLPHTVYLCGVSRVIPYSGYTPAPVRGSLVEATLRGGRKPLMR